MCRSLLRHASRLLAALLATSVAAAGSPAAAPLITAVPPSSLTAPPAQSPRAAAGSGLLKRLVATGSPRRMITLGAPPAESNARKKATSAPTAGASAQSAGKGQPLAIGFGRALPAEERIVVGSELAWQATADGGRAARIDVTSNGAAAVRVAVVMANPPPGVTLRFAGSAPDAPVFGPYSASGIETAAADGGVFWSPVLSGETATIEIHIPAGAEAEGLRFTLARVSHIVVAGGALRQVDAKLAQQIGRAERCEVDVACIAPSSRALRDAASSVAKLVFTKENGDTLLCTGTLLNDSISSHAPYLFTASHCLDSQGAAATLNTYWFFDAATCGSLQTPPYVQLADGAMLLARSEDYDWSLVRLNSRPPAGAQFSAWRAEPVGAGEIATVIHHPAGDLKKWTEGFALGNAPYADDLVNGTFLSLHYTLGSTEGGSSGAGAFTYSPSGDFYELRGGLYAGSASCSNPGGYDIYSRLDNALPLVRGYLTPDANPPGLVPVVEFYHKGLDHYFISWNPPEINDLDTGVHPGWARTGLRFLAYPNAAAAPPGANPVCRFYLRPEYGNSHFFSADPGECAATLARFGAYWIYETPEAFYIQLPDKVSGVCPPNTRPLYRFYNTLRVNHRYTGEAGIRDDLRIAPGWLAEGYGDDAVIMCSPKG